MSARVPITEPRNDPRNEPRASARSLSRRPHAPVGVGVTGVTLLMLVTMVLTTSPALGRTRDAAAPATTRESPRADHAVPTQRAERKLAGQREQPGRETSAVGSSRLLSIEGDAHRAIAVALAPIALQAAPVPSDRVPIALLNHPPPRL